MNLYMKVEIIGNRFDIDIYKTLEIKPVSKRYWKLNK